MANWNENRSLPPAPPPHRWNVPDERFLRPPLQDQQQPFPHREQYPSRYQDQPPNLHIQQDITVHTQQHSQTNSYQYRLPSQQYNQREQPQQHYPASPNVQLQAQQYANSNVEDMSTRHYPEPRFRAPPPNINWAVQSQHPTAYDAPPFPPNANNPPNQFQNPRQQPPSTPFNPNTHATVAYAQTGQYINATDPSSWVQQHEQFNSSTAVQVKVPDVEKRQHEIDIEWVNAWLRKKDKRIIVTPKSARRTLTIPGAKALLCESLLILRELSQIHTQLTQDYETSNESVWNSKCRRISTLKARLQEIQSQLLPNEKELAKKLTSIRKKRERIKTRNTALRQQQVAAIQKRDELHQQLDLWQNQIHQEDIRTRREKLLKEEADNILAEVRKKQVESTKAVDLIHSLLKLRSLRKDAAERKGLYTTKESDQLFETRLATLESILRKQLDDYHGEEKALRVMLESTREAEQIEKAKQFRQRVSNAQQVLSECLFGSNETPSLDDPIFTFWKYYTQAEESLDSLMNIRQEWDSYIVFPDAPFGGSVPISWIFPEEPTNSSWKKFLEESNTDS